MGQLGAHLTLLIGPEAPFPAPPPIVQALQGVEVTHGKEERSGFQLTFKTGRAGVAELLDYPLLSTPLLRPFSRVIVTFTFNVVPQVLMDGVITHQQLDPGPGGESTLTVTGEDLGVLMDLKERNHENPAQSEPMIVTQLLAPYAAQGIVPEVVPPRSVEVPLPIERTPVFRGTDYAYCRELARRHGHVFHLVPGPTPGASTAYWGPPKRAGVPQPALSVNLGAESNVDSVHFEYSALEATAVSGRVRDAKLGTTLPVEAMASTRPPLSIAPALLVEPRWRRTTLLESEGNGYADAYARAQGTVDAASDRAATVTGELTALRYGALLQPRGVVGLRGAGQRHDGLYYVRSVTHSIRGGDFKQRFTLEREGTGAISPWVRPS